MLPSRVLVPLAVLVVLGASACGGADAPSSPTTSASTAPSADHSTEASGPTPRLAVTHDGGVTVVDVSSGEVVAEEAVEGFVRLGAAGDGRHVLVSAAGGWQVLDLGS